MGGQPVLGGAFLLPEGELLQRRQQLASTSSPAAQEMARLRATSLDSRMAPAPSPMQSPPWLVRATSLTLKQCDLTAGAVSNLGQYFLPAT